MWASSRKQIRHSMNLRYTARGLPHRRHRVYSRTPNFAGFSCFSVNAFFAISLPCYEASAATAGAPSNGKPSAMSSDLPSSSVLAVVTTVMSMPRTFTTLS